MSELYLSFIFAIIGGLAINFITYTELRNIPLDERPKTFSDLIYVVWFFGMPILGGVLASAYQMSGIAITPILAINIGASAPLILKSLAAVATPQHINPNRIG